MDGQSFIEFDPSKLFGFHFKLRPIKVFAYSDF